MSTNLKYQYHWAQDVVNRCVEKYSRGTYNLARILDIPPGELRHLLTLVLARGHSLKWEALKHVIKYLERDRWADLKVLSDDDRKLLYKYVLYMATDDALDAKTTHEALDYLRQSVLF